MKRFIANIVTLILFNPIQTMYNGNLGTERVRSRERTPKYLLEMLCDFGKIKRVACHSALQCAHMCG